MWNTPFDESMLGLPQGVVIRCPEEYLADELFAVIKAAGIGGNWVDMADTKWRVYKEDTGYFIKGKRVLFGPRKHAEEQGCSYTRYKKCTFLGNTPDFEAASDDEFRDFLGIGGD